MKNITITHMPMFGKLPRKYYQATISKDLTVKNVSRIDLVDPIDVFHTGNGIWAISAITFFFDNETEPSLMILGTHESSIHIRAALDDNSKSHWIDLNYHPDFVKLLHDLCKKTFDYSNLRGNITPQVRNLLEKPICDYDLSLNQLRADIDRYQLWMRTYGQE